MFAISSSHCGDPNKRDIRSNQSRRAVKSWSRNFRGSATPNSATKPSCSAAPAEALATGYAKERQAAEQAMLRAFAGAFAAVARPPCAHRQRHYDVQLIGGQALHRAALPRCARRSKTLCHAAHLSERLTGRGCTSSPSTTTARRDARGWAPSIRRCLTVGVLPRGRPH